MPKDNRTKATKNRVKTIDPRTKILVLVATCVVAIFCRDALWGSALFACAFFFSCASGRALMALKFLAGYVGVLAFVAVVVWSIPQVSGGISIVFQSFRAAFPPLLLAALLVMTTKAGDLVAALYSFHMPRALTIPLAVGIRFFPTLTEELHYITDSARLQGVSFSPVGIVAHPVTVCEALFVPTVLRSAKIAEELAAAAVTRGIEKPGQRTSFNELVFSSRDIVLLVSCAVLYASVLASRFIWGGILS